ncbi:MAG: peroxide stress protein YaaA [Microbacteriaceae bacterium]|nr:peroxide stress protein YaaA [Microbacteriaceae bacterium]
MRILLPPSETKALGGDQPSLAENPIEDDLRDDREPIIEALVELCADEEKAIKALKLGPKQHSDVQRNLEIRSSPTMPAINRYTGVLFDALKAEWEITGSRIFIQSALFGLIPASTNIPYYRFSWDSKLDGINLKKHWKKAHEGVFDKSEQILDMRSKSYQELADVSHANNWVVEVLVEYTNGTRKPLNHFNKKAKGVFARFADREKLKSIEDLPEIAQMANQKAEISDSIVTLVVPEGY